MNHNLCLECNIEKKIHAYGKCMRCYNKEFYESKTKEKRKQQKISRLINFLEKNGYKIEKVACKIIEDKFTSCSEKIKTKADVAIRRISRNSEHKLKKVL
jgi:Ni,Fe-hydrogenase maturation factor